MNKPEPLPNVKTFKDDMHTVGVRYAFSLNPDDVHQYTFHSTLMNKEGARVSERLFLVNRYISNKVVYKYRELGILFELYPEIKEPNPYKSKSKIPRIHYHGWITFQNIQGLSIWYMYLYQELRNMSEICIKLCDDQWDTYVYKNKKTMKQLCKFQRTTYGIRTLKIKFI